MATSPSASCCPRSTGWPSTGGFPRDSPSSAFPARRSPTMTSAKKCAPAWSSSARTPSSTPTCGRHSRAGSTMCPAISATRASINAWARSWGRSKASATPAATCCSISRRSPASTRRSRRASVGRDWGREGAGGGRGGGCGRRVGEKPCGHALASARELSGRLHEVFDETAVYRIDHYLGKETVQNILAFRFGNGIFEPLWNRRYVNHVQITGAESIGVEGRGAYYQEAGALDDMIQNHLLQVMATIAMEPSASFQASSVRDERSKLLRSIRPMTADEVRQNAVAGQYGPARIGGNDVPGFRQEEGVDANSRTDTYAAATFFVDNWRWAGVPFYVRTGKRLAKRVSEIAIQFNTAPLHIFNQDSGDTGANLLILRIQPEEGISLKFLSKRPGSGMTLRPVSMDFNYGSSFGERSPSAYETLLLDAIVGDPTLYTRQDMVEAGWSVVEPIQNAWREAKAEFPNYAAGSWGPAAADEMLARRGHVWRKP